MIHNKLKRFSF